MSDLPTYTMSRQTTRTFTLTVLHTSPLTSSGVSGMTFTFMAKNRRSDPDASAVITKHNSAFTVVNPGNATTDAVLTFTVLPADTSALTGYTVLQLDIRVKDATGNEAVLNPGVLIIDDIVTRTAS